MALNDPYIIQVTQPSNSVTVSAAGVQGSAGPSFFEINQLLKQYVLNELYEFTSYEYDMGNVTTTGRIIWPDGTTGLYTTPTSGINFATIDTFTLTYSGKTIIQPLMLRNSDGLITGRPSLTITE